MWRLYTHFGEMPHQHPLVLTARITRCARDQHAVYVWPSEEAPRCVVALRRHGDIWQSIFPGAPILADPTIDSAALVDVLAKICSDLGASALYFPLIYPETTAARVVTALPEVDQWSRSPSPIVDWSDGGAGILDRFSERHGSQAVRKLKRWNKHLAVTVLESSAAQRAVASVEQGSWKASAGLDLNSAGQLDYYHELIRRGLVTITAALWNGDPVAYRLDMRHQRTVYAVEWSFAAAAHRLAPGMYLLTVGLAQVWGSTDLNFIDLFGSPDLLKQLVATGHRVRVDAAWPRGTAAAELRASRQGHDARLRQEAAAGRGIRRIYSQAAEP